MPVSVQLPLLTAVAERATAMRQLLSLARDSRRLHICTIGGTVAACQQHDANAPVLDTMFVQQPATVPARCDGAGVVPIVNNSGGPRMDILHSPDCRLEAFSEPRSCGAPCCRFDTPVEPASSPSREAVRLLTRAVYPATRGSDLRGFVTQPALIFI